MQEVIKLILHVHDSMNAYGKYQILFLLALICLYMKNREEDKEVFWYSVITMLILWNPVLVYGIIHIFPDFAAYFPMLVVLPIEGMIAYTFCMGIMETESYQKKKKVYWGYLAAATLVIALSGTVTPYEVDTVTAADNVYGIPAREMEVLQRLDEEKESVILLATDDVMRVSRRYRGDIVNLYATALWDSKVPNDNTDGYTEEYYQLYTLMKEPTDHEAAITKMAAEMGCTYLVISNGRREQEEAEVPRDPNQIVDLSVDVQKWCLNGFEALDETTYYHILHRTK